MEQQTIDKESFIDVLKSKLYIDFFAGCGGLSLAVGGISGIFADQDQSGNTLEALASGRMSDITMEGNVLLRTQWLIP